MYSLAELRKRSLSLTASGQLTQVALAKASKIDPAQFNRFLKAKGESGLSEKSALKLEAALKSFEPSTGFVLPKDHALTLAQKLRNDQLIIFVGSGMSYLAKRRDGSPERLPLWQGLIDITKEEFGLEGVDNLNVFDSVVYMQEKGRETLTEFVMNLLDDEPFVLSDAHEALKELPWHSVITTNFDHLLARLYNRTEIIHQDNDYTEIDNGPKPPLVHIHGVKANPHTLTAEDYREWQEKHPLLARFLEESLLKKTLLFVGFSMSDPHVNDIMSKVRRWLKGNKKRLYAWMWQASEDYINLLDRRDNIEAIAIHQEQDWAKAFRELKSVLGDATKTLSDSDLDYNRSQYLTFIQASHDSTRLNAFYVPGPGYADRDVTLEEVYVEPDLEAFEVKQYLRKEQVHSDDEKLGEQKQVSSGNKKSGSREQARPEGEKLDDAYERLSKEQKIRQAARQVLANTLKTFIVGEPGQGKTTLLSVTLLEAARQWKDSPTSKPFPVFVRLSLLGKNNESLSEHLEKRVIKEAEINPQAIKSWFKGSVLWLLDGLDEIRDEDKRKELIKQIRVQAINKPTDRWVLSTRPGPAAELRFEPHFSQDWQVFTLSSLSSKQALKMLENWAKVLCEKEELVFDYKQLAHEFETQPGLSRMRGNGLLLTLAVLFYRTHRRLPQDRLEFYLYADLTLRDTWLRHRLQLKELETGRYLPKLLEVLALEGMRQGIVSFSRRQFEAIAEPIMENHNYKRGKELDDEMHRLIAAADDLIGVLVFRGLDSYGFLHLTFQEYHAAQALLKHDTTADVAAHWDNPSWQETWALYAIGAAEREGALENLFKTIMQNQHPSLDKYLRRAELEILRLVGMGGTPLPKNSQQWQAVQNWISEVWTKDIRFREEINNVLRKWEKPFSTKIVACWLNALGAKEEAVCRAAAQALGSQADKPEVLKALLNALGDQKKDVCSAAAGALGSQADKSEVRDALLKALGAQDKYVSSAAAQALSSQADKPEVLEALLKVLRDKEGDVSVRFHAVLALSSQAEKTEVRDVLLKNLRYKGKNSSFNAIGALGSQVDKPEVQEALLKALGNEEGDIRGNAAGALGPQANKPEVRGALLKALGDKEGDVRSVAAGALGSQADKPEVREALLKALEDKEGGVRSAAARALGSQADKPEVRESLLNALRDKEKYVRSAAAGALGSQADKPEVQEALLKVLREKEGYVRSAAVQALGSQADKPEVRELLLNALGAKEGNVCSAAAQVLGSQVDKPEVREALLNALGDQDGLVRSAAAEVLGSQADKAEVRNALLKALGDEYRDVCRIATQALTTLAWQERKHK